MAELRSPSRFRLRAAGEAGLVAAGMAAFALLSALGAGRGWAAAAGLVLTVLALYLSMRTGQRPVSLFALTRPRRWAWALVGIGAVLGAGLAVLYRWAWMPSLLPRGIGAFVLVAMLIGSAEEVLYRGYVQGRLGVALGVPRPALPGRAPPEARAAQAPWRTVYIASAHFAALVGAILLAAGAHTAYKTALFVRPPTGIEVDYAFLAIWTLVGGAAFGALRAWGGNVWPALAAHAAFDLIAYGDAAQAPWWVWM